MTTPTSPVTLSLVSVSSQQANLRLVLDSSTLDLVNTWINEPSFVMEVIGGNITNKKIILFDVKPFFKDLIKKTDEALSAESLFTLSDLVDGSKYALEFHIKYDTSNLYSAAIEVRPHSFPLAPTISSVSSGNNGITITLNSITQNTIADGFEDIKKVHFVLLNISTGVARDIQVASKTFVYGTESTQSYEIRNDDTLSILNDNTYELCAYYANKWEERSPLSDTKSILVSPNPNEVRNFRALVNDASLCIVLEWDAPEGTYTPPASSGQNPSPALYAGAFTNDLNELDVKSIISSYYITRVCGEEIKYISVTPSNFEGSFIYKDSDNLVPGKDYVYSIIARNQHGDGTAAPSDAAAVHQIYYTRPGVPINVTANLVADRVSVLKIGWTAPSNFSTNGCINNSYVIKRYSLLDVCGNSMLEDDAFVPNLDLSLNLIVTTGSNNLKSYIDEDAETNKRYKYSVNVRCFNPNNPNIKFESLPLIYSNIVTALEPPDSPQNLDAVAGNTKITYTWNAPSDNTWDDPNDAYPELKIAGYSLVLTPTSGTASGTPMAAINIDASGSSYTKVVNGLTNGISYAAEISAYVSSGADGTKVYSRTEKFSGTRTPYGIASAITKFSCVASTSNYAKNTLTWDGSINLLLNGGDFVNYKLSRTGGPSGTTFTPVNIPELVKEYVDSSCNLGYTYTYTLAIMTKDKNSSATLVGTNNVATGTPISQPDIESVSGSAGSNILTVTFYQNGSQVKSLLAVGVDNSSSQNMVKQITDIGFPLSSTNALQSLQITLGSTPTNGGLVVIGNAQGFAYHVLDGNPPVLVKEGSAPI